MGARKCNIAEGSELDLACITKVFHDYALLIWLKVFISYHLFTYFFCLKDGSWCCAYWTLWLGDWLTWSELELLGVDWWMEDMVPVNIGNILECCYFLCILYLNILFWKHGWYQEQQDLDNQGSNVHHLWGTEFLVKQWYRPVGMEMDMEIYGELCLMILDGKNGLLCGKLNRLLTRTENCLGWTKPLCTGTFVDIWFLNLSCN